MLTRVPQNAGPVRLEKRVRGRDRSDKNAFFADDVLTFRVRVPRAVGAAAVVLRILPEEGSYKEKDQIAYGITEYSVFRDLVDCLIVLSSKRS